MLVVCGFGLGAGSASAEPIFLSKKETRCTSCHYSPTGGGLLTPYGRLQSRQELSTTSGDSEGFLWGVFGDALGPVDLGIDARPTQLHVEFPGGTVDRFLLMNARSARRRSGRGWTFYGEVGRRPEVAGGDIYSYEYWGAKQLTSEWAVRGGRFFPAYGIRFADHTSYNRVNLGFDKYDQVFGAEVSHTTKRSLIQVRGWSRPRRGGAERAGRKSDYDQRPRAVRFEFEERAGGIGHLQNGVGSGCQQRRRRSCVWIFAGIARDHLDAGRRQVQRRARRRFRRVRQRNVVRSVSRYLAEVFTADSHRSRHGAGLPQVQVRSESPAAHALERRRRVLPRPEQAQRLRHAHR